MQKISCMIKNYTHTHTQVLTFLYSITCLYSNFFTFSLSHYLYFSDNTYYASCNEELSCFLCFYILIARFNYCLNEFSNRVKTGNPIRQSVTYLFANFYYVTSSNLRSAFVFKYLDFLLLEKQPVK